jgi:hypothetical protein
MNFVALHSTTYAEVRRRSPCYASHVPRCTVDLGLCVSGWFSPNKYYLLCYFVCVLLNTLWLCLFPHTAVTLSSSSCPALLSSSSSSPSLAYFRSHCAHRPLWSYGEYGILVRSTFKVVSVFNLCHLLRLCLTRCAY